MKTSSLRKQQTIFQNTTPEFDFLPKIHKTNNPGKPVVTSVNCYARRSSKFVDYCLQRGKET